MVWSVVFSWACPHDSGGEDLEASPGFLGKGDSSGLIIGEVSTHPDHLPQFLSAASLRPHRLQGTRRQPVPPPLSSWGWIRRFSWRFPSRREELRPFLPFSLVSVWSGITAGLWAPLTPFLRQNRVCFWCHFHCLPVTHPLLIPQWLSSRLQVWVTQAPRDHHVWS